MKPYVVETVSHTVTRSRARWRLIRHKIETRWKRPVVELSELLRGKGLGGTERHMTGVMDHNVETTVVGNDLWTLAHNSRQALRRKPCCLPL
jgi:hypothetical protein